MTVWIENPFDNLPGEGFRPGRYELMARAFAAAGHDVLLWSSDWSHTRKAVRTAADGPGFRVRLVPTPPYRRNVSLARILSHRTYARRWGVLADRALAAGERPDLLVVSVPPLATGRVARAIRARTGCRLVADVQDLWPETFLRLLPRAFRGFGRTLLAPLFRSAEDLYRTADLVTGVCDAYRARVLSAGAADYRRFYLGISRTEASAPRAGSASRRLVYAGNLGSGYDLGTVLGGLRLLDGWTLDVAGTGAGERTLRRRAVRLGVSDRVRFRGYLGEESLRGLLAACAVGVVPLADETLVGVPNKVADYAAAGLPSVTSLSGECAALLNRHAAGCVYRPRDAASFAEAVAKAAALPPEGPRALAAELDADAIYRAYANLCASL